MKITNPSNEEELDMIHERIVKGAEYLDHPFITEIDKSKGMLLYDELVKVYRDYLSSH